MGKSLSFEKLIGKALGNYRVVQLLEAHKWGPVFLASDATGDQYIIRFIGTPFVEDKVNMLTPAERLVILGHLQQEANNLAALSHPHIVSQVDYGTYQGLLYLIYRHLEYTPLRSWLVPQSLPDPLRVGRFLEQIGFALEYAHEHAVLHRNLSTGCIFIPGGMQVMVGELGLQRLREISQSGAPRASDRMYAYEGSTESCAPEQLLGQNVDGYADIYAMGAVLYRMLTGYAPFSGRTRDEILRQHLYAQVPALKTWRADLPADLDHIIAKAMAKEPVQRFKHPTALVQAYYQIVAPAKKPQLSSASGPVAAAQVSAPSYEHRTAPVGLKAQRTTQKAGRLKESDLSRRRFVTLAGTGAGVIVAVGAGVVGAHLLSKNASSASAATTEMHVAGNAGTTTQNSTIVAKVADVSTNSATKFSIPNQQNPGILVHLPNNSFVAFDSTCPHAGCAVDYNAQSHLFVCPCHDAIFDPAKEGDVVQGPATQALTVVKVVVNPDGTITTG